ncbi:MAG TPA: hypothetical protein VN259_17055, partial [Xanthomonadales bacterium]|nr:hypothetical protein [Xanthomonadales bacterium]
MMMVGAAGLSWSWAAPGSLAFLCGLRVLCGPMLFSLRRYRASGPLVFRAKEKPMSLKTRLMDDVKAAMKGGDK